MLVTNAHTLHIHDGTATWESKPASSLIISVPHDGSLRGEFDEVFLPRQRGSVSRDIRVWPIVRDILTAHPTNVVRGLFPRRFIDYNRAWPIPVNYYPFERPAYGALEDERLAPAYYHYHDEIARLLKNGIKNFGKERVLLIDMHGFSTQPPDAPSEGYDLIFGTANRKTIPHGEPDRKLAHHFRGLGYSVFLPESHRQPEGEMYSADHTTCHHAKEQGMNAIQIEIASRFRIAQGKVIGQQLARDFVSGLRTLVNE